MLSDSLSPGSVDVWVLPIASNCPSVCLGERGQSCPIGWLWKHDIDLSGAWVIFIWFEYFPCWFNLWKSSVLFFISVNVRVLSVVWVHEQWDLLAQEHVLYLVKDEANIVPSEHWDSWLFGAFFFYLTSKHLRILSNL